MQVTAEDPGTKVYTDAAGHTREVEPTQSKHSGEWFYIYSLAGCHETCRMHGADAEYDDYCGERWEEED